MIGSLMMCASAALLIAGMFGGIAMGISHDFTLGPAHAHLNLIGGVMLFMFGLYYRTVPAAGAQRLARVQGWMHIAGAVAFPLGIALSITQGPAYTPVAVAGSLVVTAATVLFGYIVVRTARTESRPAHHPLPHPADHRHGAYRGGAQPAPHSQPVHGIVTHSDSPGGIRRQPAHDLRTDFRTHGQGIEG